MITRAIITDVDLSIGKVQIRIPWLNGIENSGVSPMADNSLSWASIICIPGINIDYKVGDIVVVGFEDNNIGKPIVLGFLKLKNKEMESRLYCDFKELKVEDSFVAPENTTIGKTEYSQLFDSVEKTTD